MSPSDVATFHKRVLVELSHAIERFALAAEPGSPLVVIAMFQRLSYFARESAVYQEIAAHGAVTLVGLVEDLPPRLPPGVRHVLLGENDDLAREWSVTVLSPTGGATLVAVDEETVDAGARTLEEGRRFRGRWSFVRADAYREVLRLRARLRLPTETADAIDAVLHAVLAVPEPRHQTRWNVPLRFLAGRVDDSARDRTELQSRLDSALAHTDDRGERDPRTGLRNAAFLQRWTAGLGAGLPVGLALLRVGGLADLRARFGLRAELAAVAAVAAVVQERLTDVDRVVRVGHEDFLVVLPSWSESRVLAFCDEVCARISQLDQQYPFVALPTMAAAVVTRERPLPTQRLVQQVEGEARQVSLLGT